MLESAHNVVHSFVQLEILNLAIGPIKSPLQKYWQI